MKKFLLFLIITSFLFSASFSACSKKKEPEKGAIKKLTDEVADEAVKHIRAPMEKARKVKNMAEDRGEIIEEELKD